MATTVKVHVHLIRERPVEEAKKPVEVRVRDPMRLLLPLRPGRR